MNKASTVVLLSFFLVPAALSQEAVVDGTLLAPLSGDFASDVTITGGPWLATEPEQPLALTFIANGLAGVKQFDLVVRLEPAAAFDISSFRFITETPFLNPIGVDVLSEVEIKMGGAILGTAVNGDWVLGTLMMQTSAEFSTAQPAQLVIQSFSIGPTSFERDDYDEEELKLGVIINAPTAVGTSTWGSLKKRQDRGRE